MSPVKVGEDHSVSESTGNGTLVFLIGPRAVGKMTVGEALRSLTGLPLFHNHLSIEAVLPVFEFGTEPFGRLVSSFREDLLREVVDSDLPGVIFTCVWAFDQPKDREFVEAMSDIFISRGGRAIYVELYADLDTRLMRNVAPSRLAAKASKRDVQASQERLLKLYEKYRLTSEGEPPLPAYLKIDNSMRSAQSVAQEIAEHFSLPLLPDPDHG